MVSAHHHRHHNRNRHRSNHGGSSPAPVSTSAPSPTSPVSNPTPTTVDTSPSPTTVSATPTTVSATPTPVPDSNIHTTVVTHSSGFAFQSISALLHFIFMVLAIYLSIKCNNGFNLGDFLLACCCPMCYVPIRLATSGFCQ